MLYKRTDFLGQKKSLSLTYDTDMVIEAYHEDGDVRIPIATYTIKGVDGIASGDLAKKENVTQPKVTLSFELTRSGLLQLNKAELKMEETYVVEERVPTKRNVKKIPNPEETTQAPDSESDSTSESSEETTTTTTTTPPPAPETVTKIKKRPHSFPLASIDK